MTSDEAVGKILDAFDKEGFKYTVIESLPDLAEISEHLRCEGFAHVLEDNCIIVGNYAVLAKVEERLFVADRRTNLTTVWGLFTIDHFDELDQLLRGAE